MNNTKAYVLGMDATSVTGDQQGALKHLWQACEARQSEDVT